MAQYRGRIISERINGEVSHRYEGRVHGEKVEMLVNEDDVWSLLTDGYFDYGVSDLVKAHESALGTSLALTKIVSTISSEDHLRHHRAERDKHIIL